MISKSDYNEVGQLKRKSLHSTDNGATFLQSTQYLYNERGWLKSSISPEFSMKLGYDTTATPQYNGNVSIQQWGTSFGNKFSYIYDKLDRLTNGTTIAGISMSEVLTYDVMGNIKSLSRDGGSNNQYHYNGNKLDYIDNLTTNYAYDGNGNATLDGRDTVTLSYNRLNLPATAIKTGHVNLSYSYDAAGQKLKKSNNVTSITTDYIGGIQYTNGQIDFIQTEQGIARNAGGTYIYDYNLLDHLGNVRVTFNKNPISGALQKIQEDDYYPFGLRKIASGGTNNHLYNGKELQEELQQYDYGARFYDPIIGRFITVDRYAEKYSNFTPYHYAKNNPVINIDINGDSTKVSGSTGNVNDYLALLSSRTGNTYAMKDGYLVRTNETLNTTTNGTISGDLSQIIEKGITGKGVIQMDIVKNKDDVLVDNYTSGAVDIGDLKKLNDPAFVAGQIGHIFSERLATGGEGGYANAANRTTGNFNSAHNTAFGPEGKIVTSMLGIPSAARTESNTIVVNSENNGYNVVATSTYGSASFQFTHSSAINVVPGEYYPNGRPVISPKGGLLGGRVITAATQIQQK